MTFIIGAFLFLVGIELIFKFMSAIFGTAIFTIVVIVIIYRLCIKK